MSGTREAGLRVADKLRQTDPDYYRKLGAMGGKAGKGHKFAHGKVDPHKAGAIGGRKRGKV